MNEPQSGALREKHGWSVRYGATVVECPGCAFTMGVEHEEEGADRSFYDCPNCGDSAAAGPGPRRSTEAVELPCAHGGRVSRYFVGVNGDMVVWCVECGCLAYVDRDRAPDAPLVWTKPESAEDVERWRYEYQKLRDAVIPQSGAAGLSVVEIAQRTRAERDALRTGRWETDALRAKGLCGGIIGDKPNERACIKPLGHGPHEDAPYWTLDEAGNAVMDLLTQHFADVEQRSGSAFIEAIVKLIQRARRETAAACADELDEMADRVPAGGVEEALRRMANVFRARSTKGAG